MKFPSLLFCFLLAESTDISAAWAPSQGLTSRLASTKLPMSSAVRESIIPTGVDMDSYLNSYSSCPTEVEPTVLSCSLPKDFPVGTYYRNGGSRYEADDGTLVIHPFDADGMMCGVTFDPSNNRVLFRNKYIETEGYMKDKETGTMSKRGIFGTMRSGGILANMFRSDFKNVANTNALYAGGKLYALWEGGKPYMLDPLSLANVEGPGIDGETDLDGLLSDGRTISAHPRYDAEKDVWISFGSQFDPASGRSVVNLYELDSKNFRSTRSGRLSFTNEGPGLLHDFIITKNYMVFNLNKATVSQTAGLKAILGLGAFAEFIAIDEEADDTQVVLIPRSLFDSIDDGSELEIDVLNDDRVSKISLPFFANFHYSNCYEDENGQVVFDTVQTIQRDLLRAPSKPGVPVVANEELWTWLYPSTLVRYSLDPVSGSVSASPEILTKRPVEFPTVPRDLSSREHRYVYAGASHKEIPGSTPSTRGSGPQSGAVIKVDTHDPSQNEVFTFETFEFVGESVFVQKAGRDVTKPGQEDAGYLVSIVSNGRDMTSDMVIFDAEGEGSITKGPVTKLRLPTFIPQGLHGCFVEDLSFDF